MLEKCKKCGELLFGNKPCSCKKFKVYYPEYYGEDPKTIYGFSYIGVAEKLAEKINCEDFVCDEDIFEYPIEITDENGKMEKYQCTAWIDTVYSATEIES